MVNKKIEKYAAEEVSKSLNLSDFLDPDIKVNDKTASVDGQVTVYNKASEKKSDINGNVFVQVKGRKCKLKKDYDKNEISFPVDADDLRNYKNNGGVIYFVVLIHEKDQRKIFYNELFPLVISRILLKKSNNKTYNLSFKLFTDDEIKKADIFLNFLEISRKETSFVDKELPTLYEITDNKQYGEVRVSYFTYRQDDRDMPWEILNKPIQAFVNLKNTDISIPIKDEIVFTETIENENTPIKIGNIEYYSNFTRIRDSENVKIRIGKSFYFSFNHIDTEITLPLIINFQYKPTKVLEDSIKDLEFFIKLLEEKNFSVGNCIMPLGNDFATRIKCNVEREKERLAYYKKIRSVLIKLGCEEDFNILDCNENDWNNINLLVNSIIDHKPNTTTKYEEGHLLRFNVLSFSLLTIYTPYKDTKDKFMLYPFNDNHKFAYLDKEGNQHPLCRFYWLSPVEYAECCVNDIESICQTLKSEKDKVSLNEEVIKILLDLIIAFDISKKDGEKFLYEALKIANWCLDIRKYLGIPIENAYINIYQIKYRLKTLNESDKVNIYRMLTRKVPTAVKFANNVLLDNTEEAELCFEQLDNKERDYYKTLPIYTLHQLAQKNIQISENLSVT
jgi:hypothetical protein